jgi:hypothetical protein
LFISYRISEQRAAQPSAWLWCSAALVQSVLRSDKHRALITAICGSIALHQPGRLANGWPSAPLNRQNGSEVDKRWRYGCSYSYLLPANGDLESTIEGQINKQTGSHSGSILYSLMIDYFNNFF